MSEGSRNGSLRGRIMVNARYHYSQIEITSPVEGSLYGICTEVSIRIKIPYKFLAPQHDSTFL